MWKNRRTLKPKAFKYPGWTLVEMQELSSQIAWLYCSCFWINSCCFDCFSRWFPQSPCKEITATGRKINTLKSMTSKVWYIRTTENDTYTFPTVWAWLMIKQICFCLPVNCDIPLVFLILLWPTMAQNQVQWSFHFKTTRLARKMCLTCTYLYCKLSQNEGVFILKIKISILVMDD